jgi:hypothetical protein
MNYEPAAILVGQFGSVFRPAAIDGRREIFLCRRAACLRIPSLTVGRSPVSGKRRRGMAKALSKNNRVNAGS